MSHPDSRFDPNGGSEPSSGRETIYWDSLPIIFYFLFFLDIGVFKSYDRTKISYTKQNYYHRNLYTYTESHLHIQKMYFYIYKSERGIYCDEPLLVCWPSCMLKLLDVFSCTYTD